MNKKQVSNLEDLELYYNKCRKVKLIDNTHKDIQRVIDKIIRSKEKTYFSKGGKQCGQGYYRSLDDVIKICKYYFPDYSLKQIIKELVAYADSKQDGPGRKLYLQFCYCGNIRKDNFRGFISWDWGDKFTGNLHISNMAEQGFISCDITLQEIIDN